MRVIQAAAKLHTYLQSSLLIAHTASGVPEGVDRAVKRKPGTGCRQRVQSFNVPTADQVASTLRSTSSSHTASENQLFKKGTVTSSFWISLLTINTALLTLCLLEAGSAVTRISHRGNTVEQNEVTYPMSCRRSVAALWQT